MRKLARQNFRDMAKDQAKRDQAKRLVESKVQKRQLRLSLIKKCSDEIQAADRESGVVGVDSIMKMYKLEREEVLEILKGVGCINVGKEWLYVDQELARELGVYISDEGRISVADVSSFLLDRLKRKREII
jgi:hypothetical protein